MKKKTATKRNTTKRNDRLEKAIEAVWGRPRAYSDHREFEYECRKYLAMLKWEAPTIEGITIAIGISRDTWERYRKEKGEFGQIVNYVERWITKWWINCASKAGRSNGAIFYISNFRPSEYKQRGAGESPDNPQYVKHITGMRAVKG